MCRVIMGRSRKDPYSPNVSFVHQGLYKKVIKVNYG
jgi:hypothetical protein